MASAGASASLIKMAENETAIIPAKTIQKARLFFSRF